MALSAPYFHGYGESLGGLKQGLWRAVFPCMPGMRVRHEVIAARWPHVLPCDVYGHIISLYLLGE